MTIPTQLSSKTQIREGAVLEMVKDSDSNRIRPLPPLKPGKVVGKREYRRIIGELNHLRKHWR